MKSPRLKIQKTVDMNVGMTAMERHVASISQIKPIRQLEYFNLLKIYLKKENENKNEDQPTKLQSSMQKLSVQKGHNEGVARRKENDRNSSLTIFYLSQDE